MKYVAGVAETMDWTDSYTLDALAEVVTEAASDLNGAAQRIRRVAKKIRKSGAAGAVHESK